MKLGQKAMEALRREVAGRLRAGDDLVAAGCIALQGTALLVKYERETLRRIFSEGFLYDAEKNPERYGVRLKKENGDVFLLPAEKKEIRDEQGEGSGILLSEETGCSGYCVSGRGGVLCALWKLAEASGVGLKADLRKIPVRQETIEICERFDLDPYRLLSGETVLAGTADGSDLVEACRRAGIPAAVIGKAVTGNDRLLYSGEIVRFLDRPGQDEITKLPWGAEWKTDGIFPGQESKEICQD